MAKNVSIINFKGGVGKTTLAFHLATYLAKTSRVLLIDVDHQSSLSIVVLGAPLWEKLVLKGLTSNRIFESFCNRKIPMPGMEIVTQNPIYERHGRKHYKENYQNLDFVAAQFELDDTEIDLASTTYGGALLSDWDKRTLIATWLDNIKADTAYDYVVFDCPPATKIMSQNALAASDCFVIPVVPDDLSSRGVTHFRNLVKDKIDGKLEHLRTTARVPPELVPRNYVPETRLAGIAPFLAKTSGNAASGLTNIHTEQLAALRRLWKKDVMDVVIKNMIGIPESVNAGWPVWDNLGLKNVTASVRKTMSDLCEGLKERIDI